MKAENLEEIGSCLRVRPLQTISTVRYSVSNFLIAAHINDIWYFRPI